MLPDCQLSDLPYPVALNAYRPTWCLTTPYVKLIKNICTMSPIYWNVISFIFFYKEPHNKYTQMIWTYFNSGKLPKLLIKITLCYYTLNSAQNCVCFIFTLKSTSWTSPLPRKQRGRLCTWNIKRKGQSFFHTHFKYFQHHKPFNYYIMPSNLCALKLFVRNVLTFLTCVTWHSVYFIF